jgi:tetratricopeptide (TPR) repeat protein
MSASVRPASFDQALALYRAQRYGEARSALHELLTSNPTNVTAWNLLGYLEADIGDAAAAANAFERAGILQPGDPVATKGRARIALERAEEDVLDRYAAALAASPDDPHLVLEQTEARLSEGDSGAITDFAKFVERRPEWTEGQIALGRMLWETQEDEGFADHIRRSLRDGPRRLDLWTQFIELLVACEQPGAAADAARDARAQTGQVLPFALMEAVYAGRVGELDRAEPLFALVPPNFPGRAIHDAVHAIRLGGLERARVAIDASLEENPESIDSWGVAELVYRALGDRRSPWLSGQAGLVRALDLPIDAALFEQLKSLLLEIHRHGVRVAGQSVRMGKQTRWRLFDRPEPELTDLKRIIEFAVWEYVAGLPPADPQHPLLRHRDVPLAITGSWSVRLTGSGHHAAHVHPLGLIGSACYFIVPESSDALKEGFLELGRPPPDLNLDLEPIQVFAPKPRRLVLFPSYFHHGTRPFSAGERLSVAFDVNRHPAPPEPQG